MAFRITALTGLLQHGINSLKMSGSYPQNEYDPGVLRFWTSAFLESGHYTDLIDKWHTSYMDKLPAVNKILN